MKNYPEEIYKATNESGKEWAERVYDLGKKHGSEPPESATWILEELKKGNINEATAIGQAVALGADCAQADTGDWHNLTEAIKEGENIDWEQLDGRKIRMTNVDGRDLCGYTLNLDAPKRLNTPVGWRLNQAVDYTKYPFEFPESWSGNNCWTLWLDGEIPMRKQTADELPFGTTFAGAYNESEYSKFVVIAGGYVQRLCNLYFTHSAKDVEVFEVLGMYEQKEEEK